MSMTRLLASLLAVSTCGPFGSFCEATLACTSTQECESTHMEGSRCVEGVCVANSFHDGGCLKSLLPDWHKIRVCNSDDPPSSAEKGFCRPSPLDYMEVRLSSQNWDSAFLAAGFCRYYPARFLTFLSALKQAFQGSTLTSTISIPPLTMVVRMIGMP
jgi:hypothetical protein